MGVMTAFAAALFIVLPIALVLVVWIVVYKCINRRRTGGTSDRANNIQQIAKIRQEEIITIQDNKLEDVTEEGAPEPVKYRDSTEPFELPESEV